MSRGRLSTPNTKTPGYSNWGSMWNRCTNPRCERYPNYGGRGIKVCDRWKSFENFYEDMGPPPGGMTLGRVDNDGDYEPSNCRWESRVSQMRNRSVTRMVIVAGEQRPLAEWCSLYGVPLEVAFSRIHRLKWPEHLAVTEPVRSQGSGPKRRKEAA